MKRNPFASTRPATSAHGFSRRSFMGMTGLGALALGGVPMLSACSGGAASRDPKDFVFTFWGSGGEKTTITKLIQETTKAAGLNGQAQSIPQNYETRINTLIAANTPPDAGYLTESMSMALGERGTIVNAAGNPLFDSFMPMALHWYSNEGAVAQLCQEAMTFYYDKDATQEAGVTVPSTVDTAWTWDQMIQAADALTVDSSGRHPSESGFKADDVQRYGLGAPVNPPQLFQLLHSNGVDMFNDDGTKTNLDSPEAIDVIQRLNELVTKHRVSPTPAQATTFGASAALLLASKRVAMVTEGTWALLDLGQSKVNYDVGALPKIQESKMTTLSGALGIFAKSTHQDFSTELFTNMADPTKNDLFTSGLWMPAIESYYTDEAQIQQWTSGGAHPDGFRTSVIDAILTTGVSYPSFKIKEFTTIATTITNAMGPIVTTPGDVTEAVKRMATTVNGQLKGAYPDVRPA